MTTDRRTTGAGPKGSTLGSWRSLTVATLLLGVTAAACNTSVPEATGVPEAIRVEDGDRVLVINRRGPAPDVPATLVEDLSIGVDEGDDAYLLGSITSIAVGDEAIYLVDMQTSTVRAYDTDGQHLRDIGGAGSGPGEFRRPFDAAFTDDGRLVVRDQLQRRTHVFSPAGEFLEDWNDDRGSGAVIGDDGTVYVVRDMIFPPPGQPVTSMMRRFRRIEDAAQQPQGWRIESSEWINFPSRAPTPLIETVGNQIELMAVFLGIGANWRSTRYVPFEARTVAEVGPDGTMVSGRGDLHQIDIGEGEATELIDHYRFDVQKADGSHMVVGRQWAPVPVAADEADWTRRRLTAQWRQATNPEWGWTGSDIPAHKGAFVAIFPTHDGDFWIVREAPGIAVETCNKSPEDYYGFDEAPCWLQPYIAEVFDGEGEFVRVVALPDGLQHHVRPHIKGNTIVALFEDAHGVARVKRLRVVPAG